MGVSRGLAAAAGCMFAAGFSLVEVPQAWAQSANPNAQAPGDFSAAPQPEDNNQATGNADTVRPFSVGAAVTLSEFYDSNAGGLASSKADAVTQGQLDASLHDVTDRFQGDLAYSLTGSVHSASSDLNSIQNYLNAIGRAELWPEHLFLNARAFAWPTFLSRLGSLNAGAGIASTANAANAYGYSVAPDLTFRFDGFATSDLIFTQSGEFFSSLSDRSQGFSFLNLPDSSHSSSLAARLKSGDDFTNLEWTLNAVGINSTQRGLQQLQRRADAVLEYHFDHSFALLADGGYRLYHVRPSLSHGLSGPIAIGGFDWTPDPSLHVIAKAGEQYNFTSYMGSVNWQVTAATTLTAALDDIITTPQDNLNINLQSLGVTSGGVFLIPPSATLPDQPPVPGAQPPQVQPIFIGPYGNLALDNDISRYRTLQLGGAYKMPRTLFNLIVYGTVRDYLVPLAAANVRQTVYGVDLSGSYNLTRDISLTGGGDYSVAQEFGGHDKIGTIAAGLNYNISPSWTATARVNYLERDAIGTSTAANGTLTDVQAGLGLRYTF